MFRNGIWLAAGFYLACWVSGFPIHHLYRPIVSSLYDYNKNYLPVGRKYYEEYLKRLNSQNVTIQNEAILNLGQGEKEDNEEEAYQKTLKSLLNPTPTPTDDNDDTNMSYFPKKAKKPKQQIFIIDLTGVASNPYSDDGPYRYPVENENRNRNDDEDHDEDHDHDEQDAEKRKKHAAYKRAMANPSKKKKSEHFEVITNPALTFKDIGGCENIKQELLQCADILLNYKKYEPYNVRIPKGVILEGPPGNGKTLLAKGFAGETKTSFIAVSGSQFQEIYIGVGPARVRELFKLAKENVPCIIFIDEIDAIGRIRSTDGETASSEKDSTLNELLNELDGFSSTAGILVMGATNRVKLLDPALVRPGRIDKKIFIGPPDSITREAIIRIHLKGKPYNPESIQVSDLVDITNGLSGAQIENLLNEAMLHALRTDRTQIESDDIDTVLNKIMVGWQPYEHQFTTDLLERIAIHEMGHALVGFLTKHHSKLSKVIINLSSPESPGYTVFETSSTTIYKREALFEHLMILLAGRIAEEVFYDVSTTTGAFNDLQEALKLAEKMIVYYGMGQQLIYPSLSDKYKEVIDTEIIGLINDAYKVAQMLVKASKDFIQESAVILKRDKVLKIEQLTELIETKYPALLDLQI